ncbi:hypothetical protein [Undibacterium pigrum]|uniref:Uncharacterized protein n=1 Tax=Undibacterium pigrum TaxID=401470 RepID=A0A318J0U7_9BURK|nr:hypothetical protein [Undibacterium pigrum]PXX41359.1 hypothetical protein DFR42_10710 [Undibacterium pigrum]
MNYQEFKKTYFKTLTSRMAELGFIKGKNDTPIYWRFPCDDQRLVWVIAFSFSARGNPYFNILIGPYWMGYQLSSGDSFPRCVGFSRHLCAGGIDAGSTSWTAAESQFERAIDTIARHGITFLGQYDSPQSLLAKQPRGILAFDLGEYELAGELLFRELTDLYIADYSLSACSRVGQLMHKEELQRTEALFNETAKFLSKESETNQRLLLAKGAAAIRMINTLRNHLKRDPKSRWLKSTLKTCETQVLASGLLIPKPVP